MRYWNGEQVTTATIYIRLYLRCIQRCGAKDENIHLNKWAWMAQRVFGRFKRGGGVGDFEKYHTGCVETKPHAVPKQGKGDALLTLVGKKDIRTILHMFNCRTAAWLCMNCHAPCFQYGVQGARLRPAGTHSFRYSVARELIVTPFHSPANSVVPSKDQPVLTVPTISLHSDSYITDTRRNYVRGRTTVKITDLATFTAIEKRMTNQKMPASLPRHLARTCGRYPVPCRPALQHEPTSPSPFHASTARYKSLHFPHFLLC